MRLLLTGKTGLIGSALYSLLSNIFEVMDPGRGKFDLLKPSSVERYLSENKPDVIIHSAAYVNAGEAELERGDKNGICWQTNVEGTKTVVESAKKNNTFVIYISTGSVFHGTEDYPGPFTEKDNPEENPEKNGWYGYTKYMGEKTNPQAIVRISHPLIPDPYLIREDYLHRLVRLYKEHTLFPLFPDQLFPLTFLPDLPQAIQKIITNKTQGIFHVSSPDMVSPYELLVATLKILDLPIDERIVTLSIDEFFRQGNSPLRFSKYSALDSTKTQEKLSLGFTPWRKAVEEVANLLLINARGSRNLQLNSIRRLDK